MSLVTFTIEPPGGAEVALDRDRILYPTARFTSQVNGAPGDFYLQVRDFGHVDSFAEGSIVRLYVDSVVKFGGFLMRATRTWPLPVVPTDTPQTSLRYWELTGTDWNVLWSKRRIYDSADLTHVYKLYDPGTYDDTILDDILANYTDIGEVCPVSAIDRVAVAVLDIPSAMVGRGQPNGGAPWAAGDTLRSTFDTVARATGGIYYISPAGVITYCDADTATSAYELSDVPSGGQIGYRLLKLTEAGDQLVNDGIVWGSALGSDQIVVSRVEDATSIVAHGRWQKALYSGGLYQQASADIVANALVYGSPSSLRGGKDPKIVFVCTVNGALFGAGEKVNCISNVFGFTQVLPVRKVTYTFATPDFVVSELSLSYEIDAPWSFSESFWPPFRDYGPFRYRPPLVGAGCGITDTFDRETHVPVVFDTFDGRTVSGGWGTSSDGHVWTVGASSSALSVSGDQGKFDQIIHFSIASQVHTDDSAGNWWNDSDGFDMLVPVHIDAVPTGTSLIRLAFATGSILAPNQSANFIQFDISSGAGTGKVYLQDKPTLTSVGRTTWPVDFYVRWQRTPSDVSRVKIWAIGDTEPSGWELSLTASSAVYPRFNVSLASTSAAWVAADDHYIYLDDIDFSGPGGPMGTADCGLVWDDFGEGGQSIVNGRAHFIGNTDAMLSWGFGLDPLNARWIWQSQNEPPTVIGGPSIGFRFGSGSSQLGLSITTPGPLFEGTIGIRYGFDSFTFETFDYLPNVDYHIRVYGDASILKAKIWKVGEAEPDWMATATPSGAVLFDSFLISPSGIDLQLHDVDTLDIEGINRCTLFILPPVNETPYTGEIVVTGNGSVGSTAVILPRAYLPGSTRVWVNGVQRYLGADYTETDPTIGLLTLAVALTSADDIVRVAFVANGPYPGEA